MQDILTQLAAAAKERVCNSKKQLPLPRLRHLAEEAPMRASFIAAVGKPGGVNIIGELKKASPSKGLIDGTFDYAKILNEYEQGGVSAVSVLTEPTRFLGSLEILKDCASRTELPLLRKDFIVDEYQLYEAKAVGASAALLIVSLLTPSQLKEYSALCAALNMDALVEAHTGSELKTALTCGPRIVGVNNRNLRTFDVDFSSAKRLKKSVPDGVVFVAESGVSSASDIAALRGDGVNAALVGEALMRNNSRKELLLDMIRASRA